MCLSIALQRPDDVLATGEHQGFQWQVIHNGRGYRCGYIRLPVGHPWHGKSWNDSEVEEVEVHGCITYAEPDEPCSKPGPDDAWWLGFDCAHVFDLPDPELPNNRPPSPFDFCFSSPFFDAIDSIVSRHPIDARRDVRSQEYVEAECRKLCDQAAAAA